MTRLIGSGIQPGSAASLASLALAGATIGTDALAWTGTATGSGALTASSFTPTAADALANGMTLSAVNTLGFRAGSGTRFTISNASIVSFLSISDTNASGYQLATGASSATVPKLIPNRSTPTNGIGGDGTNVYDIIGGTAIGTWSSTGLAVTGDITNVTNVTASGNFTGTYRSSSTTANSNLSTLGGTSASASSSATLQLAGATSTTSRVISRGSTNSTLATSNSYAHFIIGDTAITEAASGTHPLIASMAIKSSALTNAAGTTTDVTTLYIEGAPTGITPTNPATALWVAAGLAKLDGGVSPSQTVGIIGTTTNNSANAGSVGEYIESKVAAGAPVALVTATAKTITSISLTAGDWEVSGIVSFTGNVATTLLYGFSSISTTDNTLSLAAGGDTTINNAYYGNAAVIASLNPSIPVGSTRISVSATTTIYLVAQASFAVNTLSGFGQIRARRVR